MRIYQITPENSGYRVNVALIGECEHTIPDDGVYHSDLRDAVSAMIEDQIAEEYAKLIDPRPMVGHLPAHEKEDGSFVVLTPAIFDILGESMKKAMKDWEQIEQIKEDKEIDKAIAEYRRKQELESEEGDLEDQDPDPSVPMWKQDLPSTSSPTASTDKE